MCLKIIYSIYILKHVLALNNQQWKQKHQKKKPENQTKPNQTKPKQTNNLPPSQVIIIVAFSQLTCCIHISYGSF